jgi:hypothetical protein
MCNTQHINIPKHILKITILIVFLCTDLILICRFTSSAEVTIDMSVLDKTIVQAGLEVNSPVYIVNGCDGVWEGGGRRVWHFVIGEVDSELQKRGGDSSRLQSSAVGRAAMLVKVTTDAEYHLERLI